ncbi:alpha-hydroxy acid oxidase [Amnibacterium sp.]|uniref:alpha-hydroxy acid oxidase n=1 Tax=Amnibacterium sp. TaxID=1872496 RepID=UPI002616AD4D|nr:alpha-hydroxy acid oxidase [Amnibacterium sp.]MCU1474930.1 FMN-dependent alpha-hydroxy acid dehydrogenase [Amnibacterium sp.]
MDVDALEAEAAATLPPHVYDYFRATAGGPEVALRSVDAWRRFLHRPHVLRNTAVVDTATTVLGTPVAGPILVAPMAQQVAADPLGERATAAATASAGTLLGVSTNTAVPFADVTAAGAPWWFQLYLFRDRAISEQLVDRAVEEGARAMILTVDITGLQHPSPEATYSVDPTAWPLSPGADRLANIDPDLRARSRGEGGWFDRDMGLGAVEWLRERSGLPVVVKGVLRGDDARRAVDAGAAAVLVSTHGARAFASSIPSADALAGVVDAVGSEVEVYVDSGLRSGIDVATAVALGARAAFLGRPVMWGLATGGERGVRRVLETVHEELVTAMDLLGAASVADLTPDLVVRP